MESMMPLDRQRGTLIGLAVGDALGAAVEFRAPGSFPEVTGFRGGGPHGLAAGEWTDDTSMALALADSIASVGWDLDDQARRYLAWYEKGWYSVNGRCFDIGITTRGALNRFSKTGDAKTSGDPAERASGYVVKSLEAALWAFHDAKDFREAVLRAVNLGDDADTTGAVCGQLAGAYWGESGIPREWRDGLARKDMLEKALQGLLGGKR
jgi:ADP-ribosyl-[dinitrogen reductase] hydrolase